jgi:hypothetical protein
LVAAPPGRDEDYVRAVMVDMKRSSNVHVDIKDVTGCIPTCRATWSAAFSMQLTKFVVAGGGMNAMTPFTPEKAGAIAEAVLIRGDLGDLTPTERAKYCVTVCQSLGLNPMTKPFEYIVLNGRLTLYARKDATDQLRTIHDVSVTELIETEREGVFIVTAKVVNAKGRTDAAKGAVNISGLKGEALANALMKAETKAKRRATLSICGLGFLDETEVEDIPASAKEAPQARQEPRPEPRGESSEPRQPKKTLPKKDARDIYTKLQAELDANASRRELNEWCEASVERIAVLPEDWQDILRLRVQERMNDLQRREREHDADAQRHADGWGNFQGDRLIKAVRCHDPKHDPNGVVWEEGGERPATAADNDDGLNIPAALDRRQKLAPSLKERLMADIPALASPQDILHWGLAMSGFAEQLCKEDRDEIGAALQARQTAILSDLSSQVPPIPHQRRFDGFPIRPS